MALFNDGVIPVRIREDVTVGIARQWINQRFKRRVFRLTDFDMG